jgi:hypothetical protein
MQSLYEREIYPRARALENIVPFGAALHHTYIDPLVGMATGESADQRQAGRESYDEYIRQNYPGSLEGAQLGADVIGSFTKGPTQMIEPAVNQAVTHPESVGVNVDTALSALPIAATGLTKLPKMGASFVGRAKARPAERASLAEYSKDPYTYDRVEMAADGKPREALIREMQGNISDAEAVKAAQMEKVREAMMAADRAESSAIAGKTQAKQDIGSQRAYIEETHRIDNALGSNEGAAGKDVIQELKKGYENTAVARNAHLEKQGTMHDPTPYTQGLYDAELNTTDGNQMSQLRTARKRIQEIAGMDPETQQLYPVDSRKLNDIRKYLQDQVENWGTYMTRAERGFAQVADTINTDLDNSVIGNNAFRSQLKQQTVDYKEARKLFGGDYNINKLKSALTDPQKRAVVERIIQTNTLPQLNDAMAKVDEAARLAAAKRLKLKQSVPAEGEYDQFEAARAAAVADYLNQKNTLQSLKDQKLPMSERNVESTLRGALLGHEGNPRLNPRDDISQYANEIHPQGPDDFYGKLKTNKVLRDVHAMDSANGSRMVNLGRYMGGAAGGGVGYMMGNTAGGAAGGAAAGAYLGSRLDTEASGAFRSMTKYGQTPNVLNATERAASPLVKQFQGVDAGKLVGTKYEQQMSQAQQQDPAKAAVLHYMLSSNDPEYQQLMFGNNDK